MDESTHRQQQLAALRERRAKATPGAWAVEPHYCPCRDNDSNLVNGFDVVGPDTVGDFECPAFRLRDADFIAHSPADIDLLLALLADAERKADDYARDCEILLGAEWRRSVQATNGDPEAAREHRIAALVAELATATEWAERAADARQAEIVAWLRKQASIRARASVTTRNPEWSAAHAEVESFCDSAADAIEAGDFKAKGNDDAPRSD